LAMKKVLSDIVPFEETYSEALKQGLVLEQDGFAFVEALDGPGPLSQKPSQDGLRDIAVSILGGPSEISRRQNHDLAALALRQLYVLSELVPWPSAQHCRCALLFRIVAAPFGSVFGDALKQPAKAFQFDEMSRRIYLSFAGVQEGTVLQADAALLSRALGAPADTVRALTAAIVKAAIKARISQSPALEAPFDLESFAGSVRRLASHMETKPYAGRVAIAEVYDAGLSAGLNLGNLDEFKANLALAAREGLLDLERYDITGPLDAGIKERSRLRLGRDERHFIVNQWI
jgi:hypothetical protein